MQKIYSIHDDYFSNPNFSLENLNFDGLLEIIINVIFNLFSDKFKDIETANYLINLVIIIKDLQKNLNDYKAKKK